MGQPRGPAGRPGAASRPPAIEVAHAENGGKAPRVRPRILPLIQAAPAGSDPAAPRTADTASPSRTAVAPPGNGQRPGQAIQPEGGAAQPPAEQAVQTPEGGAVQPPAGAAGPVSQSPAGAAGPVSQPPAGTAGPVSQPPAGAAGPVSQPPAAARHARPPAAQPGAPGNGTSRPASVVTIAHGPGEDRPAQTIERALSGPGPRGRSWNDRVRLVPGGQGPGRSRETEQEDRDQARARLPLPGPRKVVVLGCTSGAGQTVIALMTARLLASLRAEPVAALDLNPGNGSLAQRAQPASAWTVRDLLGGTIPASPSGGPGAQPGNPGLQVISPGADPASVKGLGEQDFGRIGDRLAARYAISLVDPGASAVTRVLDIADQLVLVAPASGDAPRAVSMTLEWLASHDHDGLAASAVMVINGVSGRSMADVERAEAIAAGRCRAVVRVPWEDQLGTGGGPCAGAGALRLPARLALTALAGLLVSGLGLAGEAGEPR